MAFRKAQHELQPHRWTKHEKPCLHCGKNKRYRFARCRECFWQSERERKAKKRKPQNCAVCQTEFTATRLGQKYCSVVCSGKENTRRQTLKAQLSRGLKSRKQTVYKHGTRTATRTCIHCKKSFEANHYFARIGKANFCTMLCWKAFRSLHKTSNKVQPWDPKQSSSRGKGWQKISRRMIVDRFDKICQGQCIKPECSCVMHFVCDHIVPYHLIRTFAGKEPNAEINLTVLCESCHGKKTRAERCLFAGDVIGFLAGARRIFRDMGPIKDALEYAGLLPEWQRNARHIEISEQCLEGTTPNGK